MRTHELDRLQKQLQTRLEGLESSVIGEWKVHPVTELLIDTLRYELENCKELWLSGTFTEETADGTVQKNARALGVAQSYADLLDIIRETGTTYD